MKHKKLLLILGGLGLLSTLATFYLINAFSIVLPSSGSRDVIIPSTFEKVSPAVGSTTGSVEMGRAQIAPEYIPPYQYPQDDALNVTNRVYTKSANYSVIVENVSDYLRQLREYTLSINGRVLSSNLSSYDKYTQGFLELKVPVDTFDEATGKITAEVKEIISENVNAQDVTGEVVNRQDDVQQLQDQKTLVEAQLADAKTEVEKKRLEIEIARLDREIAAAQQRIEQTEAKVEYASIFVSASDSVRYFRPNDRSEMDLGEEMQRAWNSVSQVLLLLLRLAIWVVIYGILWLPLILLARFLFRLIKPKTVPVKS